MDNTSCCQFFSGAWWIKKFKISKGDVLISAAQNSFVENCLNSYNNKNLKIGLITTKDFNLFYNSQNSVYARNNNFRFSKASWFYNRIFESLLGLSRSLFLFYGRGKGSFIMRYQKPINEIFDQVIIRPDLITYFDLSTLRFITETNSYKLIF